MSILHIIFYSFHISLVLRISVFILSFVLCCPLNNKFKVDLKGHRHWCQKYIVIHFVGIMIDVNAILHKVLASLVWNWLTGLNSGQNLICYFRNAFFKLQDGANGVRLYTTEEDEVSCESWRLLARQTTESDFSSSDAYNKNPFLLCPSSKITFLLHLFKNMELTTFCPTLFFNFFASVQQKILHGSMIS